MIFKRTITTFFFSIALFSFAQCKTIKPKTLKNENKAKYILQENAAQMISKLNRDKSMDLRLKKIQKKGDPAIYFEYAVYDITTKKILKQGSFRGVNVDWHDNTSIKLVPYIGMEQKPTSENPDDILLNDTQKQITIINIKH